MAHFIMQYAHKAIIVVVGRYVWPCVARYVKSFVQMYIKYNKIRVANVKISTLDSNYFNYLGMLKISIVICIEKVSRKKY